MSAIFITGGTGYIGRSLIKKLVATGHDVTALVRHGSQHKLPPGVRSIIADPFNAASFRQWIPKGAVVIHLLGSSPAFFHRRQSSTEVDFRGVEAAAEASEYAGASHFIYVSVAHASVGVPLARLQARQQAETYLQTKRFRCTVIRPWHVAGWRNWWPVLLLPFYTAVKLSPAWRRKMAGLSFISLTQMIATIQRTAATPPAQVRIIEAKHMKRKSLPVI